MSPINATLIDNSSFIIIADMMYTSSFPPLHPDQDLPPSFGAAMDEIVRKQLENRKRKNEDAASGRNAKAAKILIRPQENYGTHDPQAEVSADYKHAPSGRRAKAAKILIRPQEDYGTYDPQAEVTADYNLDKYSDGKKNFWFFILCQLTDPTKKSVISWTGRGLEFVIKSPTDLVELWRQEKNKGANVKWDSFFRNFRHCYKRRIMMPVNARRKFFAFITEPSVHISGWRRQNLLDYIKEHQSLPYPHPTPSPESDNSMKCSIENSPVSSTQPPPPPVPSPVSLLPFSIARILGL